MRYFIFITIFISIFSACAKKPNNELAVFRATEEGLQQSIKTIFTANEVIYRALQDRLVNPMYKEYAIKWQPRAMVVKSHSDNVIKYIEGLKEELKNEAGKSDQDNKITFKEDDVNAVNHLFNDHEKGKELFNTLTKYRQDILTIDPEMNKVFEPNMIIFTAEFDHTKADPVKFSKAFVNDIPAVAAMTMLSKFENNIRIIENNLITFCINKINPVIVFDTFMPIISLSSNTVKPGDEIEVTAGIGAFSSAANPKITIEGKPVPTENGMATYKLKTSLKPGDHDINVVVEFKAADGRPIILEKRVIYTVFNIAN